ncbi:MAG: hypothetical protein B7Z55_13710 [Planctomycetales bacterium 12-60-4]|nr:MAG: hypothetical protein B7Z55_13710 [Planctomycetales bacterium 12-60-4]
MGCDQDRWTPPGQGKLDQLSPILQPLQPVKDQVTVITNLRLQNAYPGTHDTSNSAFLSAASAKHTESSDYFSGITADQIAAAEMGRETQVASLQLAMDLNPLAGVCNNGYSCVYQNCLSWSSPTTPLPSEAHPRVVFERLFGEGGNASSRRAALRYRASLLDSFTTEIARLKQRVGVPDRARLDQYLESIQQVEREIKRAEQAVAENKTPDLERPVGVPARAAGRARLHRAGWGHLIAFQFTREQSNRTYPEIGVRDPHHPTSHHGNDPYKVAQIAKINTYHVSLFSQFLQRMKATPDGEGSLLDHSVYLYGSGMGNPSLHDHENLPILVAGGASTGLQGGRHIRYEKPANLANLHLTLLERVGVKMDSFVDSTGKVEGLFDRIDVG